MAHAAGSPAGRAGFLAGTLRGEPGFFCAGQDGTGRWWLIDPHGAPFFAKGVHGVRAAESPADGVLVRDAAVRLRGWGFNCVGLGNEGEVGRDDGLPFLAAVEFCCGSLQIVAPGLRLPDVFHPDWPELIAARAREACAPLADTRELIGWVTDDRLDWAAPTAAGRPSLLQLCLSLEPGFAAYHAAWEFVLALHGGRLDALARAWNASIPNKEMIRELTRAEEGIGTRGYWRDEARWARQFARRYFAGTASAIRAADPHHLVLGCRFARLAGPHVLSECVYPAVDVALPNWNELPAPGAMPAHPVLAGEVGWTGEEFLRAAASGRSRRLTSVERMLQRGRAALERVARHPSAVGYVWTQWQDEPGEQPPFARGLVHVNGTEAREHTEVLAHFNSRAETLRRNAPPPAEQRPTA